MGPAPCRRAAGVTPTTSLALGLEQRAVTEDRRPRHGDDHAGVLRRAFEVEAVGHLRLFPARTLPRPTPVSSGDLAHLIIGTDAAIARARGRRAVRSLGLVPGASRATSRIRATTGATRRSGRAIKIIGSKDVFSRPQWVGPESIGRPLVGKPPSSSQILARSRREFGCGATIALSRLLHRPSAAPTSTHAGKEFHLWDAPGTVVGGNAAGVDPN